MKEDRRITQQDVDEASVTLKPIAGIRPGYYLALIYGLGLVALLFMILVFPGIKNPGSYYVIASDPPGSAIFIDSVYRASTPSKTFISKGQHTIEVKRPNFETYELYIKVPAQIFGSLFAPRPEKLSLKLKLEGGTASASILLNGMKDFSWWAQAGTPSEPYQVPMLLSEAATAWSGLNTEQKLGIPDGFTEAALSYATNAQSTRDALRAATIVQGDSLALTPASLAKIVRSAAVALSSDPRILELIAVALPQEAKAFLQDTDLYRLSVDFSKQANTTGQSSPKGQRKTVSAVEFVLFNTSADQTFGLATTETTVSQFRTFLAENPAWSKQATKTLAESGLVSEEYLFGLETAQEDEPVRYVSRAAAEAYCQWLARKAPAGFTISLPTEMQWNSAASLSQPGAAAKAAGLLTNGKSAPLGVFKLPSDPNGLRGMLGSVWEWCADSYTPYPSFGYEARLRYPAYDGLVRGASWANKPSLVDIGVRGPMDPVSCTAYLGFRAALIPASE